MLIICQNLVLEHFDKINDSASDRTLYQAYLDPVPMVISFEVTARTVWSLEKGLCIGVGGASTITCLNIDTNQYQYFTYANTLSSSRLITVPTSSFEASVFIVMVLFMC
jgi:hypothetical protein